MSSVLARRAHENETHSLTPECAREGLDNRDEESIIQVRGDLTKNPAFLRMSNALESTVVAS